MWEEDLQNELEELRCHSNNVHEDYHRQVRRNEAPPDEPRAWNEEQVRDILIETSLKDRRNPNDPIRSILIDPDGESITPLEEIKDASDRRRMEHILNSKFGSVF